MRFLCSKCTSIRAKGRFFDLFQLVLDFSFKEKKFFYF
jgi:hypothetical protein